MFRRPQEVTKLKEDRLAEEESLKAAQAQRTKEHDNFVAEAGTVQRCTLSFVLTLLNHAFRQSTSGKAASKQGLIRKIAMQSKTEDLAAGH